MAEEVTVRVFEIVGNELCVASDDGQKVYEQIAGVLKQGRRVTLSFLNVKSLTSAFLNTAIGQLYGQFSEDQIRGNLKVSDLDQDDLALLKRVVDTAKEYFKNPERLRRARSAALEDEDE